MAGSLPFLENKMIKEAAMKKYKVLMTDFDGSVQEEDVIFDTRVGAERYTEYLRKNRRDLYDSCDDPSIKELYRADFEIVEVDG
jgi:hypothetical protein